MRNHGQYSIKIDNQTIHLTLSGTWNEDTASDYTQDVMKRAKQMNGAGFFILLDALEFTGATPEAFQQSEKLNIWLSKQKLLGKAIVHRSPLLWTIAQSLEPSMTALNIKTFDSVDNAREWIHRLQTGTELKNDLSVSGKP